MPNFSFKALDPVGRSYVGEITADSPNAARMALALRGDTPLQVKRAVHWFNKATLESIQSRFTSLKPQELILFTKQLCTLIRVGAPLLRILEILEKQTENVKLKRIIGAIASDIEGGATFFNAFKKHPNVFSPLYCNMVQAGESSGTIPEVLARLIFIIEHDHQIKTKIRAAMQYPMTVLVALVVAFVVVLTMVIPKFVTIFENANLELPLATRICIMLSNCFTQYGVWVGVGCFSVVTLLTYILRTKKGRYVRDVCLLRIPIVGPLLIKAAIARFASIFSILHGSGLLILDSIRIVSGTIGNAAIARELTYVSEQLEEGRGLAGPLGSTRYFTPLFINMVAIGEESGKLDDMMSEAAQHYDTEVGYAIGKLMGAIGPCLTVVMACMIGFFAMAIYMPMWDLSQIAK